MLKYILAALISGLLLALGWPSKGFPLLLFFGFVPLLMMEHRITNSSEIKKKE